MVYRQGQLDIPCWFPTLKEMLSVRFENSFPVKTIRQRINYLPPRKYISLSIYNSTNNFHFLSLLFTDRRNMLTIANAMSFQHGNYSLPDMSNYLQDQLLQIIEQSSNDTSQLDHTNNLFTRLQNLTNTYSIHKMMYKCLASKQQSHDFPR